MVCWRKSKTSLTHRRRLKEQRKKCAQEMKNAMQRKSRLQGKARELSDRDLVEVLRMRKAKKDSIETARRTPPPEDSQTDL